MASYFDQKPPSSGAATAELLDVPNEEALGKMGLMSPQVTRIFDNMEFEEHSSSGEDASLSEDNDQATSDKGAKPDHKSRQKTSQDQDGLHKSQTSPLPHSKHNNTAPSPKQSTGLGGGSRRQKHPNLARFQSLRSMLFQATIEDKMEKCDKEGSESKWAAEHDQRRGLNRPKTPESPPKDGFTHRLGNRLRRMTTKEVPTMKNIEEADDNESTASSEDEDAHGREMSRRSEDETINHSDIEDLVRWVSRRDPPSDGEARKSKTKEGSKEDSGHESLGHSDVDELVRWVSRREAPEEVGSTSYTDVSTESDDEEERGRPRKQSSEKNDVDDLVRWISHKDGPNAGPVHDKTQEQRHKSKDHMQDPDVVELLQWVKKKDDTSGESDEYTDKESATDKSKKSVIPKEGRDRDRRRGSTLKTEVPLVSPGLEERGSLKPDDVDELVRWVSRKDPNPEPVEAKSTSSSKTEEPPAQPSAEERGSLQPDDVDDIVRWMSRKSANSERVETKDSKSLETEEPPTQASTEERGSLKPDGVDDLVRWVSRRNMNAEQEEERDDVLKWKKEEDQKAAQAH